MDTEYIRNNIATDRITADMQMSIVKELKEIKADLLTDKRNLGLIKIDRLIYELEEDAKITYNKLEVLRGETK